MNKGRPKAALALLVHGNELGNRGRVGQRPASLRSPVPGVDSAGRPNQCGA
jgi:hypothetical protein